MLILHVRYAATAAAAAKQQQQVRGPWRSGQPEALPAALINPALPSSPAGGCSMPVTTRCRPDQD